MSGTPVLKQDTKEEVKEGVKLETKEENKSEVKEETVESTWLSRLGEELADLEVKAAALTEFLASDKFFTVSVEQQALLLTQSEYQNGLIDVFKKRIALG